MAKILYIDDRIDILQLVKEKVEETNPDFKVVTALVPRTDDNYVLTVALTKAITLAASHEVDAVMLDYRLGDRIKATHLLPFFQRYNMPVIVFSGWIGENASEQLEALGVRTVDKSRFGNGDLSRTLREVIYNGSLSSMQPSNHLLAAV